MSKKVLLLIVGAFLLTIPVGAFGAYSSFYYPNVPVFNAKNTNGVFNVYIEKEGIWQNAGVLSFDRYFRQRTMDITNQTVGRNYVRVKLKKEGGGAAHIDSVLLNSRPPLTASGIGADIKKLKQDDFDVVDVTGKGLELEFPIMEGKARLSLSARIEELVISKVPFQYPVGNLYKEIGPNSQFYNYRVEQGENGIKKQIFREYSLAGSGHPSGQTYCWASHDGQNLYFTIDFTPDNTMDGEKDYAKVYVRTEEGIKEFKLSVPETKWGNAAFTYTDKVPYQHKVYDFVIPLQEIGITDTAKAADLKLAFAAYGTAAPAVTDLQITKADGLTSVAPGQAITYTIAVTNSGPNNAMGATVTDFFPVYLTGVTWTCVGSGGATCAASGSGNISDTINIPVGGTATYTVNATVSASAAGTMVNVATVAAPMGVSDPVPGNNSSTDIDTITAKSFAVPTMTEWGMIVFIALTGLGSVYYLRRHRRA